MPRTNPILPWYRRPMRIAALQCNFEKNTLAVVDKWAGMGFNVEQLLHPIADLYSAHYDPAKHDALLKRYIAKSHRKGIRIILYLNIHILGPAMQKEAEAWAMRDAQGAIIRHYDGTYPSVCTLGPWREHFFATLESVKKLPIDGLFLDGPALDAAGCRCAHCRATYEKRYGEALEKGSHLWDFNNWTTETFLTAAYAAWHEDNPDRPVYHNLPIQHASRSFIRIPEALAYNDIVGTEGGFMHYGPAHKSFLFKPSTAARLLEAVAPDKPRVIFMAGDHKPWSFWPHAPADTALCIASCTAHGANVWYGIHGSTPMLDTPSGKAASEMFRYLKRHARVLGGTRSCARVGVVFSFETDRYHSHSGDESDFLANREQGKPLQGNAELALRGYTEMLTRACIPFDLVSDHATALFSAARYDVMILPSCGALSADVLAALRKYVHDGGTLLAQADSSLFGHNGRLNDFALAELFGARFGGQYRKHANWNYARITNPGLRKAVGHEYIPLPLVTLDILPLGKPRIHAEILGDMPGRYTPLQKPVQPLLLETRSGKGVCYYLAAAFGEMAWEYKPAEYVRLLEALIRPRVGGLFAFDNPPALLETAVREKPSELQLHLVNYSTGFLRPFDRVTPVRGLEIRLPKQIKAMSVKSLRSGKKLPVRRNRVVLPELGVYDVLLIET